MKKIIVIAMAIMLTLTLTACGNTNTNIASNMSNNLNKLNGYIKNVETISDSEIVISDLISENAITTIRNIKPSEKITNSQAMTDVKNVAGNAIIVPNYNRNTDTYGNYYVNNAYGYNGYNGGYGYGFNNGYGYNMFPNWYGNGIYPHGYNNNFYNGNGIVGTNIDTYRDNINYNNLYNRYYRNNNVDKTFTNPTTKRFQKNINTYRNIASNINTYKKANYQSRYDISKTGYETDLNNHYQKLNNLCAIQVDTLNCNDQTNSLKTRILANISYLNSLAEQIKIGSINITTNQAKAIKDLLNNANNFANKINTSKNELKTELKSVSNMKVNYSANVDELSSKYIRLLNSLDTRNSYLQNILSSLMQIENIILYDNYKIEEINEVNNSCSNCSDCPNCTNCPQNINNIMPPPKNTEIAEVINDNNKIIDSTNNIEKINDKEININEDDFKDKNVIENGKIKKIKQNDNIENVDHIVKDNPKKITDKDLKNLKIAGERIEHN